MPPPPRVESISLVLDRSKLSFLSLFLNCISHQRKDQRSVPSLSTHDTCTWTDQEGGGRGGGGVSSLHEGAAMFYSSLQSC